MPSRIAELCHYDVATLTRYLEVCERQWREWRGNAAEVRVAAGDPAAVRFCEEEETFWQRFAELLRIAIHEADESDRRTFRRRSA
ncbi:hypothetical protein IA539_17060 [Gordonia sp. zg691]|nr:hypothetical protein [Gordonia jinghuaiqii]MBD0862896.1 hypothetical protein [Gordonia jinghuaiqii]